jgi:hypothetical protein
MMSDRSQGGDDLFERVADKSALPEFKRVPAPSRLKSRIYSALIQRQVESGPLLSVSETKAEGRRLCVFENLVQISPVGEKVKSLSFCRVCHARVLAETMENAPIYWRHCPYVQFQTPRRRTE